MTAADVLDIIGRLDRAGIRWWVHGGWGMDALLEPRRVRTTTSIWPSHETTSTGSKRLSDFRRLPERDEWLASFVLVDARDCQIDVHRIRLDEHGTGWQEQRSGEEVIWSRSDLAGTRADRRSQRAVHLSGLRGALTRVSRP